MIRQDISIKNYKYIVDLYKSGDSDMKENHTSKYVMIRNFDVRNTVIYDSDIYFIEKSLLEEFLNNGNKEIIAFPIANESYIEFSNDYSRYNSNYNNQNFYIDKDNIGDSIYNLYKKDTVSNKFIEAEIRCDKVRIYHPHIKRKIDAIVYCDTFIHNVHVHIYCRQMSNFSTNSETEFRVDHNIYSEFVEFYIPCIEDLISKDTYYKENLGLVSINDTAYNSLAEITDDNDMFVSTYLYSVPFEILEEKNEDETIYKKNYLPEHLSSIINNHTKFPISIGIYPYTEINDSNVYVNDDSTDSLTSNKDQFVSDYRITIASKMGFSENFISIINEFQYPEKSKFTSFAEAYKFYNNVDLKDYIGIINDEDDDYNEENPIDQKQCGFRIDIYSDIELKQRVWHNIIEIENPENDLDNFSFNLNNLFDNWKQYPDILMCQCRFIDKYIGKVIYGNPVAITKEWFKYLVKNSDSEKSRISFENEQQKITYKTEMDLSKINFINNINCIIKREEKNTPNVSGLTNKSNSSRIIYKPVFYKVQDLQKISLKSNLIQNIGINLSEYMTKVDTFKLNINNTQYVEYARNDIYVIFKIDANVLNNLTAGEYHILNQDDEYISSGQWVVA